MTAWDATETRAFLIRHKLVPLLLIVLGSSVAVGLLASREVLLAGAVGALMLLAVVIFVWPESATLAVMAILYSNAAVIAVRFHGVPFIVGAFAPLLLAIPIANSLIFRRQKLIITPTLPLLFLFLGVQIFATLFSKNIGASIATVMNFVVEGIVLYFLVVNAVRTPEMVRRVIWVLLITGALIGGLSFYQQITGTYDNNYAGFAQASNSAFGTGIETLHGESVQPRLAGQIGEKNSYARIMLMLVPLGLFRFWGERSRSLQLLALAATVLITLGMALAFSRGAAIGFVLMLILMVSMRYIKPHQILVIFLGVFLLLQAVPEYGMRLMTLERLSNVADQDTAGIAEADSSTRGRVTEMLAAALMFADHPLIGVGPDVYPYLYRGYAEIVGIKVDETMRRPHSLYLGMAAELGVFGLISFLAIVFVTLRNLARARAHWSERYPEGANMATGFLLAIVVYMTASIFLHLAYIRYFWLMMALADAAGRLASTDSLAGKVPDRNGLEGSVSIKRDTDRASIVA